jgi:tRNA(Ile)-lysidine synthase
VTILQKIKRTISEHKLISRGDSILIALSGGPDSVALLRVLIQLRKSLRLSLAAVYVNHQLRPGAARKEEQFCQKLCDRHLVDLTIVSEDIRTLARSTKGGIEETARDFRYDILEQLADEDDQDRIALGHHVDDRAETVLFRILRGTGPAGLVGIPVTRGKIIRPLHNLTKQEIYSYLKQLRQDYCRDRSNQSDEFSRNYLRLKLLPAIRQRLNPQVDAALLGLSEIIEKEDRFLERLVTKAARKSIVVSPGGKLLLDLDTLDGYDKWLRRRLLRRCLKALSEHSLFPGREVIDRLDKLCYRRGKGMSLPDLLHALVTEGQLVLYRRGLQPGLIRKPLVPEKKLRLECPRLSFRSRLCEGGTEMIPSERRSQAASVDWDRLRPPLELRGIRPGDRFRPLGLRGSKKVSDYLADKKVPRVFRDEIPLLCDREGIIWLVGYEIADRVKIDTSTRKVFTVEYQVRRQSPSLTV